VSCHPYLFFNGTCRRAMTRCHELLGGKLDVMTVGDMPEGVEPTPGPSNPDLVLHAALAFEGGGLLMASDDPTGESSGMKGASVSLILDAPESATRVFDGLAEGGEVTVPLGQTFFSPRFGMCVDRFGTNWMVSVGTAEA
jgi:PhnB protein